VRGPPRLLCALLAIAALACGGGDAPPSLNGRPAQAGVTPYPPTTYRYFIGGDARDDGAHVLPWALHEVGARGLVAVLFLGDMEHEAKLDDRFAAEIHKVTPIAFYPVLGNHEVTRRPPGTAAAPGEAVRALSAFAARFLGTTETTVKSVFSDKLVYSVDLPGYLHFVALDNVSQPGFGADQLAWLDADLARPRLDGHGTQHVIVGMHKALAGSGVTTHAMDEDGPAAVADSDAAFAILQKAGVELVVASHFHAFAEYTERGLHCIITGGLGAPLDAAHGADAAFHHFLVAELPPVGPMAVSVVRFPGTPSVAKGEEE
jgi:Calcineurin-like phosphoesterase